MKKSMRKLQKSVREFKEDIYILQKQIRGRSVYGRARLLSRFENKRYSKHKKSIYLEYMRGV